jgi:hypothetical protein
MTTVHTAGEMKGPLQKCSRCGYVLIDRTHEMVPEGSGPPGHWEVGGLVAVTEGNPRHSQAVTHVSEDTKRCNRVLDDAGYPLLGTCLNCGRHPAQGHTADCRWKDL